MRIEKGIPIPYQKKNKVEIRNQAFELMAKMEVGDSILVEGRSLFTVRNNWLAWIHRGAAKRHYPELNENWRWEAYPVEGGGVRIWRVK